MPRRAVAVGPQPASGPQLEWKSAFGFVKTNTVLRDDANAALVAAKYGDRAAGAFATLVLDRCPAKGRPSWKDKLEDADRIRILDFLKSVQECWMTGR